MNAEEQITNRMAYEEAAGMGLSDLFFIFNKIDPDAVYVQNAILTES